MTMPSFEELLRKQGPSNPWFMTVRGAREKYPQPKQLMEALFTHDPKKPLIETYHSPLTVMMYEYLHDEYFRKNPR